MDQAGTSPVKTTELSTFIQATILPLTAVVVQSKGRLFQAYPCQQLGRSLRMQTGEVPTGDPMGAGMCPQRARARGGGDKGGQCHFSDTCLEDLPCRVRMCISKAKQDQA